MSKEEDSIKEMERESFHFFGTKGKVKWVDFEKSIARHFRMKFGSIGEKLWMNELPIIEGDNAIGLQEFADHAQEVLEAIGYSQPQKYALFKPRNSGFWEVDWHVKWRKQEYSRLYDVVAMRCRGQAAITLEALPRDKAPSLRKYLMKKYGGASADVRRREKIFDAGMPDKPGAKAFPKGINMEDKLDRLKAEWVQLTLMCPAEHRAEYEYAKESYLVKMVVKHITNTEYYPAYEQLLNKIEVARIAKRAVGNDNLLDAEEIDREDWEQRNYQDGWLPSFDALYSKLVDFWKEKTYGSRSDEGAEKSQSLPSMVNKVVDGAIKVMLAPNFGLRPQGRDRNSNGKFQKKRSQSESRGDNDRGESSGGEKKTFEPRCWGCGQIGHRINDPECKAEPGARHESAPKRSKLSSSGKGNHVKPKSSKGVCKFFQDTGKCKFGAKCKFVHDQTNGSNLKGLNRKQKSSIQAFKVGIRNELSKSNDIDKVINKFLMIRTIPRECSTDKLTITLMNTVLVDESSFAFDSGSGEGISVHRKDFAYLDESEEIKSSVEIQGPSVGAPICIGRGPLVYRFTLNGKQMGLVHSNGILANIPSGGSIFRLVSAMQMERYGIRYVAGSFETPGYVECVRSGLRVPTLPKGDVLYVSTSGFADEIVPSAEFRSVVAKIADGLESPLVDLTPFLLGNYSEPGESNRKFASQQVQLNYTNLGPKGLVKCMLMNEAKLTDDELSRLYCRRFGYVDTKVFKTMASMSEHGNFPNLKVLNEDNIGADLAKWKRGPYKRNDPDKKLDSPPWWHVDCDGYGGGNSMGDFSEEGAIGSYLFTCRSTGSTDIRLYASHYQFPVALHQFLVRVQAEFWTCRVIFVDTHSVNLSKDVEEVLALFQVQLVPISAGTPQELGFAETRVKMIRRVSTAMLAGAPHLGKKFWALSDRNAVLVLDFMPQSTRHNLSSFYMRTGRQVDWTQLGLKVFGAPCIFAPIDGPIHKRAPITEEGYYLGYQWPAMLVLRRSDGKVISVSRQKVRVYESAYIGPLNARMMANRIEAEFETDVSDDSDDNATKPDGEVVFEGETVQSIKALRDHKLKLPGRNHKQGTDIEESARFGNVEAFKEGLYFDDVLSTPVEELAARMEENSRNGLTLKESLIKAVKETTKGIQRLALRKGKKSKDAAGISKDNIVSCKRKDKAGKRVSFKDTPDIDMAQDGSESVHDQMMEDLINANDKYEAAIAMQPEANPKYISSSFDADDDDISDKTIFEDGGATKRRSILKSHPNILKRHDKIADNYSESSGASSDTIFQDEGTIGGRSDGKVLSKGNYDSEKMLDNFSDHNNSLKGSSSKRARRDSKAIGKHKMVAKVGDLISVSPKLFDSTPGSYSGLHPERCLGTVSSISKKGIAKVIWIEDGSSHDCKLRDLTVEKRKFTSTSIVAMLIEGNKVAFAPKDVNDWPKDFFEVLVRADWRKWVEAVKKEIAGWDDNNAVELVNIEDVPASAKIIPLGELYTIKRNGTYKFRQYLMGNLLRPGIDFQDNYSTTISSTGTTLFFSLATTSGKMVHGWDAVCGYLQTKEQFDIYCYLPSHEGYSTLEYEEIAELRKTFLKLHEKEGMAGVKRFARNHRKQYRANPKQVYKCNSSIYGNLSAGAEFEKLMHHAHIQVAGMTQTQPEPSMFVKIKVDDNDVVVGYLIVIAFVDDVRMFGTEPELQDYKAKIASCMKVKFDELPVPEFVGIQTYQNLEKGICELKMPNYWNKARTFFKQFRDGDFKKRYIPLSVLDETEIGKEPTPEEIADAKGLPYLQAVGLLSYPAAQCKFEIRYAVSLVSSRRNGWSRKHFDIVVKIYEYSLTTCEMGVMYAKGLDPHGDNVVYAHGDANHRLPRSQECRIVMMNCGALSLVSKKQTKTAPSSTCSETTSLFNTSTDVLGVRNLMTELGMHQEYPTVIYQDNKSTIQIANNRGSLGKASRAMDLEVLAIRNRIEDHEVGVEYCMSDNMNADLGTKALGLPKFPRFRDSINGYALVKAAYPDLDLPDYVYEISDDDETLPKRGSKLQRVQAMIMKFHVEYIDEDFSGNENDSVTSDSEYIPPERLRGGCDDDNYDEGDDIQFAVEDDFQYDEESACSAHGFDPVDRNEGYLATRLRGGAEDGNDDALDDYDWRADMRSVSPSFLAVPELSYDDVTQPIGPLVQLSQYDPDDIFSMKLKSSEGMVYSEEIDDLPDPRHYDISVEDLHLHVLLFMQAQDTSQHPFHDYERYLRWIDPDKKEYRISVALAWDTLYSDSPPTCRVRSILHEPTLIAKKFQQAAMRNNDPSKRYRQIQIVIEAYVRSIENHFHKKLKEYNDNVQWDMLSVLPSPKDSYLRWIRWRCYFRNRLNRYLDDPENILSPIDDITQGCPQWREVDEVRATKRNWFVMYRGITQYVWLASTDGAYQEDVIPNHPGIHLKDILFWDLIPLWNLRSQYAPQQRIFNSEAAEILADSPSPRQQRMVSYLQSRKPKWGRNVVQTIADPDGWGDDQFPPAPKKLKVVHESSDDKNLGS